MNLHPDVAKSVGNLLMSVLVRRIKMKLKELNTMKVTLIKILNTDLPFETSYALSRTLRKTKVELDLLEEKRMELIKKYGKTDPNTNQINVEDKNLVQFTADWGKVLDTDIELEPYKIPNKCLKMINLSANDIINLGQFVEEVI